MALKQFSFNFSTVLVIISVVLWLNPAVANVTVDPFGIAVSLEADGEETIEMVLANNGEDNVTFEISLEAPEEELRHGPRRDDLGDVIDDFNVEQITGLTWDGNLMWGIAQGGQLIGYDVEEEEIVERIGVGLNCFGLTYDGNSFWMGLWGDDIQALIINVDREGDVVRTLNVVGMLMIGVTWDGENLWYYSINLDDARVLIRQITPDGDQVREVDCSQILGGMDINFLYITWVPEHEDGYLWALEMQQGELTQVNIEGDEPEVVQEVRLNGGDFNGLDHDGENLWFSANQGAWFVIDDGIIEPRWITVDPNAGEIAADEEVSVDVIFTPEEMEAGVYEMRILIELTEEGDDPQYSIIEISAVMSVDSDVGSITGTVTDAGTEEPINGARIDLDRYIISGFTAAEGEYAFANLPLEDYVLTVSATDYLPFSVEVIVDEADEFIQDIELLHSECNLDRENVLVELEPDADIVVSFNASNDGNGPLTYTVERKLIGDADADPWELRQQFPVGEVVDDSRIQGVVFANDHFYASGAHDNEPAIYIFDRDGEYQELFIQPGEDRYGMRDLTWDGNLIWGPVGSTIYGITTDGEEQVSFESPFRSTTNIAWDPVRQCLWVSGTTSNLIALDRNGEEQAELNRQGLRIYGLACYPDDPDGYPLYIFHKLNDVGDQIVHKMNTDNSDTMFVRILEPEGGGSAAGVFITNELDVYSWVFMAVANAGADDRVDIWHLDSRMDWFIIDPVEGMIEAGEEQEFELTLDATGLPTERFEGELVFIHDGVGGETALPVTLNVVIGNVPAERILELEMGWNMVSVNLQPDPDDIREITRELVEADLLLLMKDGQGRFYSPEFDFCNIPGWNVAHGYQMKMDDASELTLEGITVMADEPLPLTEGWNLIAYYPRVEVDAIIAFSGIVDRLLIAKDGWGRFYNPEWEFSNMGNLQEGRGYQVKVTEDLELVYRLQEEEDDFIARVHNPQGSLPVHPVTGHNMSLLLIDDRQSSIDNCQLSIGVYADGQLVGSGILEDGVCGIAIWGDDPTTTVIDGALTDQPLTLVIQDKSGLLDVKFKTLAGENLYTTNGFWAVELEGVTEIPAEFGIISAYPNPFNSRMTVKYSLPESGIVNLSVFDLTGRQVLELASSQQKTGVHSVTLDGKALASGIYFVELHAIGRVSKMKIVLLK